jgi:transcriptional regulator with XRE-family HTH domain
MNPFSVWFAEQIKKSGLKMKDVAEASGLSPAYLSMLLRGNKTRPSRDTVQKIAVSLARLLDKSEFEVLEESFRAAGLESPPRSGNSTGGRSIPGAGATIDWLSMPPIPGSALVSPPGELREVAVLLRPDLGVVFRLEHYMPDRNANQWIVFALDRAEGTKDEAFPPACSVGWFVDGREVAASTLGVGQRQKILAPLSRIWEVRVQLFGPTVPEGDGLSILTRQWAEPDPAP